MSASVRTQRRAWLQKHATPLARDGRFHWYPADGDGALRAEFAERLAGASAPCVLWRFAPERVAWAHVFAATAPGDGRPYRGLALTIVDDVAEPAGLLAALTPEAAAPWHADDPVTPPTSPAHDDIERAGATVSRLRAAPALLDPIAVARALIDGGNACVGDVAHVGLPRAIAPLERAMPARITARVRRGAWLPGDTRSSPAAPDRLAALAVAAVNAPASRAALAWRLVDELAGDARDLDAALAAIDRDAPLAGELNAWGRGRRDDSVASFADRVAARALAALVADRDPAAAIAEARWRALLPAARRADLLAAIARRAPSLAELARG
jgi:hypothetical protein